MKSKAFVTRRLSSWTLKFAISAFEPIVGLMPAFAHRVYLDTRLTQLVPAAQALDAVSAESIHPQDHDRDGRALRDQSPRLSQQRLVPIAVTLGAALKVF